MDDILSPIAKLETDDFTNESSDKYYLKLDDLNGNFNKLNNDDTKLQNYQSLQSSLENLVNNFDSIISNCFCDNDENIDSFKPISDKYQSMDSNFVNDNQIWLSLTSSLDKTINLNWKTFKTYDKFKNIVQKFDQKDVINQNFDLPDDKELIEAFDYHSKTSGCLPCDFEPLKSADEIIDEIDDILGIEKDDVELGYFTSSINKSELTDTSYEESNYSNSLVNSLYKWTENLSNKSTVELNSIIDEIEQNIRHYSAILVNQLDQRDELEHEKEQRDLFVQLMHQLNSVSMVTKRPGTNNHNSSSNKSYSSARSSPIINPQMARVKSPSSSSTSSSNPAPKRSNSWKSIFTSAGSSRFKSQKCPQQQPNTHHQTQHCCSTESIPRPSNDNGSSIAPIIIPVHAYSIYDRTTLVTINRLLQSLLTNTQCKSPKFNALLTDYIINVYAPADIHVSTEIPPIELSL